MPGLALTVATVWTVATANHSMKEKSNDIAVRTSSAPGSSRSRRRCRVGWRNVSRRRRSCECPAADAPATCAAELLARGLGGCQGGRCRGHVGLSVHPSPRECVLRDPQGSIQGPDASSGRGVLERQPAGSGRTPEHQATCRRLPKPLQVALESVDHFWRDSDRSVEWMSAGKRCVGEAVISPILKGEVCRHRDGDAAKAGQG